jgi:hypothetical protein
MFKLKEIEPGKTTVSKGIKSTVKDIDPTTGTISWKIESTPDFDSTFNKFVELKKFLRQLSIDKKEDPKFQEILKKVNLNFNNFRTHLRTNYPNEYEKFKIVSEEIEKTLNEISTISSNSSFINGDTGENHTGGAFKSKSNYDAYTTVGYKKVAEGPGANFGPGPKAGPTGVKDNVYVKNFKYKLVDKKALNKAAKGIEVKQLWEATDVESFLNDLNVVDPDRRKWIAKRLNGFNTLETKLNQLIPLLQQAKHKTLDYYRENPESFSVVYGTDLANDYLNDLIELFTD